jgi:hypothetical protein
MSRTKVMLLSLLAITVLGSVASTTASAVLQGPWWRHPEALGSQKQVKWPMNEEHPIISENEGAFVLKGELLLMKVTIECQKVENKGNIWNGAHQGEDQAEVAFSECSLTSPIKCANVEVSKPKVYTELMWKYRGETKELTEAGGQQKIFDVFAPTEVPKKNEAGEWRSKFVTITIPAACKPFGGEYNVEAAGTKTTFVDQFQEPHEIVWGTAAQVEPQNEDVRTAFLKWSLPNVTKLHHQETEIIAKLMFGNKPAELQGRIKIKLVSEEPFGAYNE